MDLTFLGTGAGYPSPSRGATCIIFRNNGVHWMFDCGEGSQTQLMKSRVKAGRISRIFITHLHGDHIFGLPGLLCTISLLGGGRAGDGEGSGSAPLLRLYGPRGLRRFVRTSLELSRSQLSLSYEVHELVPHTDQFAPDWPDWEVDHGAGAILHPNEKLGSTIHADADCVWHVCSDDQLTVKAGMLKHRVPSFGYVIQEAPLAGKVNVELLTERGIPPGPLYARIKAGESLISPSGDIILPEEVVGPKKPGRKVVVLGDTCGSQQMAPLCTNADVVVHECTLEDELAESALEKGHSTAGMAGSFARLVGARQLIVTHFSQRYRPLSQLAEKSKEPSVEAGVQKLLTQAMASFGSSAAKTAEDFDTFVVSSRS